MSTSSFRNIPTIIRYSVLQAILVAIFAGFLLSFVYAFVHHYEQKRFYVQQLGGLLASSASTPDGANLVARQVTTLLDNDSALQSILFYSTEQPIDGLDRNDVNSTSNHWRNALLADTISFNYPVMSRYLDSNNAYGSNIQYTNSSQSFSRILVSDETENASMPTAQLAASNALVGYIHITLDINKLRWHWIRINLLSWLTTVIVGIFIVWFILRKLNWPTKDIIELAKVCEEAVNNPELEQLPTIQQRFGFQELLGIKKSFIILFDRLRAVQEDYHALEVFEQQLHSKDLSLDIQRSNFQNMITHELKTSLNAITGGLQLLNNQFLSEEQKDTLAIIRKGSQHLELTLEQIIQLNRIEKGQVVVNLTEFNPLQMIADLLEEFEAAAKEKEIELIGRIHHMEYALEGDASKIQRILVTLIDNAIKFTHTGQIIIDSQLTHFHENVRWQVKIIDTGIGIDKNYLEDIFTPFFQVDSSNTREYEGVGIGLSVTRQLVQLLGATIDIESELGVGSQFIVTMSLRHSYHIQDQHLLKGVDILYYHHDKTNPTIKLLRRLGASVHSQRNSQSMLDYMAKTKVDTVMFAEELLPEQVIYLARCIRKQETTSRSLLIYWYPAHKEVYMDSYEYDLKAAGLDYFHTPVHEPKALVSLLKKWLV